MIDHTEIPTSHSDANGKSKPPSVDQCRAGSPWLALPCDQAGSLRCDRWHVVRRRPLADCCRPPISQSPHLLTLCEQLLSVILRHYCFHNLVADGWQHTLLPVHAKALDTHESKQHSCEGVVEH